MAYVRIKGHGLVNATHVSFISDINEEERFFRVEMNGMGIMFAFMSKEECKSAYDNLVIACDIHHASYEENMETGTKLCKAHLCAMRESRNEEEKKKDLVYRIHEDFKSLDFRIRTLESSFMEYVQKMSGLLTGEPK